LKAAIAFVAALVATALASAQSPSSSAPLDAPATTSAPSTAVPPPAWLLRDAGAVTTAPAIAPQERLPLVRGSDAHAAVVTAPDDGREALPIGDASDASTPAGPASTTAADIAARLWRQLEALPLFALLAGVAIAALLLRAIVARSQHGAARPEGVIEILARYPVGRRQQIVMMRVGRRVIVAHQADRAMRTLSETGDPDEVAELIAKAQAPGRDLFSRLLERRRAKVDPFADAELVDLTRAPAAPGVLGAEALERPVAATRAAPALRAGRGAGSAARFIDGAPGR